MRGQRSKGKIQRNNYHHGSYGTSLTGKTMSVFLIFTQGTHKIVKNRRVRSSLKSSSVLGGANRVGSQRFHTQLYRNSKERPDADLPGTKFGAKHLKHAQQSTLRSKHEQQP